MKDVLQFVLDRNVAVLRREEAERQERAARTTDMANRLDAAIQKLKPSDRRMPEFRRTAADTASAAADACAAIEDHKAAQRYRTMAHKYERGATRVNTIAHVAMYATSAVVGVKVNNAFGPALPLGLYPSDGGVILGAAVATAAHAYGYKETKRVAIAATLGQATASVYARVKR